MKRMGFKIILALALWLGAGAPHATYATSKSIQLADYHDKAQRRELQRLRDERQRALEKAAESRKRQPRRSRRSVQNNNPSQQRLTLALPPGWSISEARGPLLEAAIGDTPALAKARIEKTVYIPDGSPGRSPAVIVVERFRKSKSLGLEQVYRRWREKINARCADGRETGPDDSNQDGQAVIDSFYACDKRKSNGRAEVSMVKIIDGPAELFVVSRHRQSPSLGQGQAPDTDAVIDDWRAWSAVAAKGEPIAAVSGKSGDIGDTVSKGYGFVVSRTGHLLTLHSLVKDCAAVRFSSLAAEMVASDPDMDLAIYKLGTRPKSVAVFRKGLEVGQRDPVALPSYRSDAVAIELSVTTGSISAVIGPGGDP